MIARAHRHIFISEGLVGSLPGLQQSLTRKTEDSASWATFYQLYWITMQIKLPPPDISSIQHAPHMHSTLFNQCDLPSYSHPSPVTVIFWSSSNTGGQLIVFVYSWWFHSTQWICYSDRSHAARGKTQGSSETPGGCLSCQAGLYIVFFCSSPLCLHSPRSQVGSVSD